MSSGIPVDLPWRDFEKVLGRLGYEIFKSSRGAARTYRNPNRDPEFITFHESHGSRGIPKGTLRMYIRNLKLSVEEFSKLL